MRHRPFARHLGAVCFTATLALAAAAGDWPQWCGTQGKNMVSPETGLPESFAPGQKRASSGTIDPATAQNVKWGVRLCKAIYSTPTVADGRIFIGGADADEGIFDCLDAATGKVLWQWHGGARKVPASIDGFSLGIHTIPARMGVCSSAAVDGDRVYFVTHSFEIVCANVNAPQPASARPAPTNDADAPPPPAPRVVWSLDLFDKLGVFPCDAVNGSPVIDGDLLYVQTCNGVDRNTFRDPYREKFRKFPAPDAPNLIAIDKRTGRVVATDDLHIAERIMHGQWSSPSIGTVGGRKLVFYCAGDGHCYAFEALGGVPVEPVKLKMVWSFDCDPPEYRQTNGLDVVTHYTLGDKRNKGTQNRNDGTYVGMSEIIATPVVFKDRIYVAIGRDPEHGRGRGAMQCIDATKTGDVTRTARIWTYQGMDRTLSTASVADGLVYICDVAGRLHCLDADTGKPYWVHDTKAEVWGSTLVADGKVYMPTAKGLYVLSAGKELKVLAQVNVGAKILCSPVAANGRLYIASTAGWLWSVGSN